MRVVGQSMSGAGSTACSIVLCVLRDVMAANNKGCLDSSPLTKTYSKDCLDSSPLTWTYSKGCLDSSPLT